MITINIQKQLGTAHIQADMQIPEHSITAIYGHSGAGKTSIINMLAGLLKPDLGSIVMQQRTLFDSEKRINLPPEQRQIGYIFQDKRLFNFMSVKRNLLFSGKTSYHSPQFNNIVELLGLSKLLNRAPGSLSGGEAQRVAIGRALLSNPKLLLLDEPMSFLDAQRKQELMAHLERIPQLLNVSLILVTHAADEIERLASQIYLIENGKVSPSETLPMYA
ncbi:ATP-binding cassette domain-containing protein [Celerinatantimonas sp. YJH-8]|uniref:ATP-binding cassette domain-containing protein n=1 Tax=Celerinatantimonas sp. YJH-8 TaxID=3228714 RepID=UPI0038C4A55D